MDSRAESAAAYNVLYEDIEPFFEWETEDNFHVLVVMLPGFRRDQLKVQVTSTPILKISAQRQISGNRWRRVYKEFSFPSDSDPNDITAKFESGTLKIKFSKLTTTPSSKSPERDANAHKNNNAAAQSSEDQPKPKIDDQASEESHKKKEELATKDDDGDKGKTYEKNSVHHQKDQEKAKNGNGGGGEGSSRKTNLKGKEHDAEGASYDFSKEKGKMNDGVDEKKAVHEKDKEKSKSGDEVAHDGKKKSKNVSRLKTRLLDFTLTLRPSSSLRADDVQGDSCYDYKEALSDLAARLKKMKNLVNLMVGALLVLAFALYLKNSFKPSLEGPEEYEL